MTPLLWTLVGIFVGSLVVSGIVLWLSCKVVGARRSVGENGSQTVAVGLFRSLFAAILIGLLSTGAMIGRQMMGLSEDEPMAGWIPFGVFLLAVSFLILLAVLRTSAIRAIAVMVLWQVVMAGYGFGMVSLCQKHVAEGFILPTGSMAPTLYGTHKEIQCPTCQFTFRVNASVEVAGPDDQPAQKVARCACPNCRQEIELKDPGTWSDRSEGRLNPEIREIEDPGRKEGDRVLIGKGKFGATRHPPRRLDLIGFHYPAAVAGKNVTYVKRLVGLPGETIALYRGDLYVLSKGESPQYPIQKAALWKPEQQHRNDPEMVQRFRSTKDFEIVRKSPSLLWSLRKIVYDNDHIPKDRNGKKRESRWKTEGEGWKEENGTLSHSGAKSIQWLRYHHAADLSGEPSLVMDFSAYNPTTLPEQLNPVGDLILECEAESSAQSSTLALELNHGVDRFRATWDLSNGHCTLTRNDLTLATKPTVFRGGAHRLRFANVDRRLTVWVDETLPFGEGVAYDAPAETGPTAADLRPAAIGAAEGPVRIRTIRLWRDIYYSTGRDDGFAGGIAADVPLEEGAQGDPAQWEPLRNAPVGTFYVQPGHYFVLGDNSSQSADSRFWGSVAQNRLLGRVEVIYYPFSRARKPAR